MITTMEKLVLLAALATLAACGSNPPRPSMADVEVKIVFDAAKCPVAVDPPTAIDVSKSADQRIAWQAVQQAGGGDLDTRYEIFFDPFKGRPLKSNKKGYKRSPKIDGSTPTNVEYKYSIRGEKCSGEAYDPRFRVMK